MIVRTAATPTQLPGPASAFGSDGLPSPERRLVAHAAAAHSALFASSQWLSATANGFDAAGGIGALLRGCGVVPTEEYRLPALTVVVATLERTAHGDALACLADPTGSLQALVLSSALASVRLGAAVRLLGASLLAPSAQPRQRCLLVAPEHLQRVWLPEEQATQRVATQRAPRAPTAAVPSEPPRAPAFAAQTSSRPEPQPVSPVFERSDDAQGLAELRQAMLQDNEDLL